MTDEWSKAAAENDADSVQKSHALAQEKRTTLRGGSINSHVKRDPGTAPERAEAHDRNRNERRALVGPLLQGDGVPL